MLTDTRFWVGAGAGIIAYHVFMMKKSKKG